MQYSFKLTTLDLNYSLCLWDKFIKYKQILRVERMFISIQYNLLCNTGHLLYSPDAIGKQTLNPTFSSAEQLLYLELV